VIKYKALDTICLKYNIEEEQLKHVLYITYIVPNQTEKKVSKPAAGRDEDDEDGQLNEEDFMDPRQRQRQRRQSFGQRNSKYSQ